MRKTRKRIFAAVLAAALLFTMPGMASYAEAEGAQTEDISESATVLAEYDAAEETEAENEVIQEPETEDSDTDKLETGEDDAGDAEQGDTGAQDAGANLCAHHKEHTQDCGYSPASEDGEGSPCTYECRICPIEDMIAALPDEVTEGNAEKVRVQLDKILALYRELSEDEQEQIDLTRCYDLQAALDEANAPMKAVVGDVELSRSNIMVTFTAEECGDNCQGHIITQTEALQAATVIVESGTHNVTFSGLNITPNARVGVMPGATMNLTLQDTNTIQGDASGIYVPEGATLVIEGNGSLTVSASNAAAGIGGAFVDPSDSSGGTLGNLNCGTIVINGGIVTATGATECAGIGGATCDGYYIKTPGNGGTVTINGGTVTATGGGNGYYSGAGIGGGTYSESSTKSGSGGTLTINGGNVTLTAGHSSAYGFGRGSGTNNVNAGTLTLADANCLTLSSGTTLDPKGTYSINGDPTSDMIVVPTDLVYTGQTHDLTGKIYIDDSKTGTAEYFEQTFNVTASADGWVLQDLGEVVEAGDYTVTFTKGGKSISTTFTVAECPHTGLEYKPQADNKHGGTCPTCGTEVSEEHTWADGVCSVCNLKAVAKVETSDGTIVYLGEGDFANAFDDRKYNNVTVTLLSDIQADSIEMDDTQASVHVLNTSTLDLAGHTITSRDTAIYVYPTGNLTIQDSSSGKTGQVVSISSAAILTQTGMVSLTGGTYTGIPTIDGKASSTNVSSLLANYGTQTTPHYAYFNAQGNPISLGENQRELTGTVMVKECKHEGVKATPNNDGTHSLKCLYCGYTAAAENCSYGTGYQHNDTNHWKTCTICQGTTTPEAHYLRVTADEPVNGVTKNYEKCEDCDYNRNPFTVTVTVPSGLTYGSTVGIKPSYTISTVKTFNTVQLVLEDWEGNKKWLTDDTLPDDLSVGTYKLYLTGGVSGNPMPVFLGRAYFTVSPAPLTENKVTLSTESITYSGAEQKPTITVKQGETTLAPGTDYDVAYSTTDFTNAGTITVTITGKGNYTGTVKTTYTIKKAPLTITASDQTITYGGSITQGADNVTVAGLCTGDVLESITLTAGTANVPGGNITPSAAGIKNSGGRDVTGNYEITYKNGGLTINKADAEITVGTNTYNNTFGDAAFTLDVTDNNTEADVQYEVEAGADVISVSNGTVTIRNAGTATITVSLPETANYNAAASKTITVTVAKKDGYTVTEQNRSYLYSRVNTGSIDLAALLPKDCETITYGTPAVLGDVTYSAVPAVNNGILSYTLNSGSKNAEGTITVTVSTRNYTDIAVTVKVKLTDQMPVSLKTGTEVTLENNVLTYGEPLSKLKFNKAEFVDDDGKAVLGTLAWKDAAATPNAGTTSATWVFTPNDEAYASVEGTAAITVNKAAPVVSVAPTVAGRVYDPSAALQDSDLKGGTVNVPGTWSWQKAGIVPAVNNSGYNAVFTPEDTTNYETVPRTITVNVSKATPYIAGLPAAAAITYGETLKDSLLSGGIVQYGSGTGQVGEGAGSTETVAGAFTWKEPSAKPVAADSNVTEYTVVFTPSDTADYNPVEAKVRLTVNKAQNAPNMPGSAMSVSNSIEKVGSVPLPAGWEWQVKDIALEVGVALSAVAVYIGADKGNYENETVTVAITRSSCDHVAGDVLYTGEGEKASTCTDDGLGHKECTICGAVMESGIVAKALGHTGGTATCSKKAVCTRCNQPYGDTDSSIHGGTEVRGFVAATCTAGGYTGDTYCKDCGAKTGAGNATPALGHDYTGSVTKEPTIDSEGERTYTCTRCGDSYKESMPRLPEETHGHSYTDRVTKEPTCTDTGVRTYTCTCGDSYTETIAALGHHYLGSETKKPTTAAEGVMTYTCDRCGHSYTRSIAKLPGDGTTKPGSSQPGDTEPGNGSTEETGPEPGIPFIKGENGKTGWEVIRAEEEQAKEGSVINVDMNGTTVVPGDIFDRLRGRDITITFDMGGGIIWSVDGKSVTADKTGDIDFSVKTGVNAIPVDIVNNCLKNNVTGERYSIQISLAYEGEFGFTAVLSINLGKENAGYTASLYYYNQSTGELEFICADEVAEDGTASLAFTHASDYVIVIDGDEEEENSGVAEDAQPQASDGTDESTGDVPESPEAGKAGRLWWIIVAILLAAAIGTGTVLAVKKKGKGENSGQ